MEVRFNPSEIAGIKNDDLFVSIVKEFTSYFEDSRVFAGMGKSEALFNTDAILTVLICRMHERIKNLEAQAQVKIPLQEGLLQ